MNFDAHFLGTFIALDIIMQRLRNESKVNIFEAVKKLRFQRMKMVQTMAQYSFLYSCTFEVTKAKYSRSLQYAAKKNNNNKKVKKVSFQDETDLNALESHIQNTNPLGRRKASDLSTISETEFAADNGRHPNSLRLEGLKKKSSDNSDYTAHW